MPKDATSTSLSSMVPVLRLEPLAGPVLTPLRIDPGSKPPGSVWVIGRSSTTDVPLQDPEGVVSRQHCDVGFSGRTWVLRDLGSRHGTFWNGTRLQPQAATALSDGDRVRIGPWTLRVGIGESQNTTRLEKTVAEPSSTGSLVRKLAADAASQEIKRRLDLITQASRSIAQAESETQIAGIALDAVSKGTGFPRAAIVRMAGQGEQVAVVASIAPESFNPRERQQSTEYSRSLITAASEGHTVLLNSADRPNFGESVMRFQISAAICCPIVIDGSPDAFLYVDARAGEARIDATGIPPDLANFCDTIARMVAMAFADLYRKRLEAERERANLELEAAREVQKLIMPPMSGRVGALRYELRSIPGRTVAGDLFDFIRISDTKAAILLGDVAGKGVAAGMVMANVQGHLNRMLRQGHDPATALNEVNRIVAEFGDRSTERMTATIFLSLWAGVFDLATRTLSFVDAGHGLWMVRPPGQAPRPPSSSGALPVGVDGAFEFVNEQMSLDEGLRLYLYSDGVTEVMSPDNVLFGPERVSGTLASPQDAPREIALLIEAMRGHAQMSPAAPLTFADDVTIAVIQIGGPEAPGGEAPAG